VKIVIDTNIWISFLFGKTLAGLENYIFSKSFEIITSNEQLIEISSVLQRPRFRKYVSYNEIEELLFLVIKTSKIIKPKIKVNDCRDKKDNFILEIALSGEADLIVTGDKDLLVLNPYKGIKIMNYREFQIIMNSE
jgi:uncharacterized protein